MKNQKRSFARTSLVGLGGVALTAALIGGGALSATADADLAEGMVGSQDVFDTGANYRGSFDRKAAANDKIAACMSSAGFDYRAEPATQLSRPGAHQALLDTSMSDLNFAKQWGFGLTTLQDFTPSVPDGVDVSNSPDNRLAGLSAKEQVAYEATLLGDGGCEERGMVNIGAGMNEYFDKADAVREAKDVFASSPPVVEYYSEWSACMADRGHAYDSPVAAHRDLEGQLRDAIVGNDNTKFVDTTLRQREISLAVDTVECGGPARDLLEEPLTDAWVDAATGIL